MAQRRWRKRPPGSNWGHFGPDDQLGRLNLLTPERVLKAVAEVRVGKVFSLSLPLDLPGGLALSPRRRPPQLLAVKRHGAEANYLFPYAREHEWATDVLCDDAVLMFTQYSTQWDALAHIGSQFDADDDGEAEIVFYNGWRGGADIEPPGHAPAPGAPGFLAGGRAGALGIERIAATGVQGRGVLVDLRHHLGSAGGAVGGAQLRDILASDGIVVEEGDILCLHTGYGRLLMEMAGSPDVARLARECAGLDGRDPELLDWIRTSGIAAIAADNHAVEVVPAPGGAQRCGTERCASLPLHEHCLFKLGIPLGELWYLSELADWLRREGRSRFLLTAPPLNLPGAVGSPVTPVATV